MDSIFSITTLKAEENHYRNVPLLDFAFPEHREGMKNAIDKELNSRKLSPYEISSIISGNKETLQGTARDTRSNPLPENTSILYSKTIEANIQDADQALKYLSEYFSVWSRTSVTSRAGVLRKAAELMLSRRYELICNIVLESGKPWADADGDFAEAVDFLRYYADMAEKLFLVQEMGSYQGEKNIYFFEPRGVCVVICPWNFPLAIPCGMFSAALVCGNTAILKPSEQTPVIAKKLFDIFLEAGLPAEAAAFIPGEGEIVGDYLAKDSRVSTIVFTGSRDVGLNLIKSGAETKREQQHVKRVIAEMGGKNAIVVDADADLDEAVKGVLYSAFGYQGQKCSACSRAYIVGAETYLKFKARLALALSSIKVGPASDPGTFVGPVISEEARSRIFSFIEQGKKSAQIVSEVVIPEDLKSLGYYVSPIIFDQVKDDDPLTLNEIFGPVLALYQVQTFEEGVSKAVSSEYRLTGGVFSRSPKNIDYAYREFKVGNLYINRGCTGALVYRQAFGGAFMSGVGSKAGGPDYLQQFVIPRVVSENTMRRGFAPEV